MWVVLAFIFSNLFSILLFFVYGYLKGFTKGAESEKKILNKTIWHDLLANPDDLPEEPGIYIVLTSRGYRESELYKYVDTGEKQFDSLDPIYAWCESHFEKDMRWSDKESKKC